MNRDTNPGVTFLVASEGVLLDGDPKDIRRQGVVLQHSDRGFNHLTEVTTTLFPILSTKHDRFPHNGDSLLMRPYDIDGTGIWVELTEGSSNAWLARVSPESIAPIFNEGGCAGYTDHDRTTMYRYSGVYPSEGTKGFVRPAHPMMPPPSEAQIAAALMGEKMWSPCGLIEQYKSILEAQNPESRKPIDGTSKGAS